MSNDSGSATFSLQQTADKCKQLVGELDKIIIGHQTVKERVVIALMAGGHALIEGVPGTGKTLLALTLAKLLGCQFKRIQFTPDLMPTDLLGTNVFNQKTHEFEFHSGPIFTDILLADEVNRTPPRTQSALLEAMQERAVTIDGTRRSLTPAFFVLATQNPVEFEGTYPLPEAQRDRFLLKINISYPNTTEEVTILDAYASGRRLHEDVVNSLQPIMDPEELINIRRSIGTLVRVEAGVQEYIVNTVTATRSDASVQLGAGPRASLALLECGRVLAMLRGRDFITPDDIKELAPAVLAHRVSLSPEAEMEGLELVDLLHRIFEQVEVPR